MKQTFRCVRPENVGQKSVPDLRFWLLSDPLERTVTPNGKQTVKQREADTACARLRANLALKYAPDNASVRTVAEAVLRDLDHPAAPEVKP